MKIYNIQQTTNNNYTQKFYQPNFKAFVVPNNMVTDTFEQIINPKNKAVYEKLVETFKDHTIRDIYRSAWISEKEAIENAYKACLDSSGEINDYALASLYKLCYKKWDVANPWNTIINFVNDYILVPFFEMEKESSLLKLTKGCKTYRNKGIAQIAEIIGACKDNDGNHNQINLDFANYVEKNCNICGDEIAKYIKFCKDPKTGICRKEYIQLFKDFYKNDRYGWLTRLQNEDGIVTEAALNFFNICERIAEKEKKSSHENTAGRIYDIMNGVLEHARGKDRDEIITLVSNNIDLLMKNINKKFYLNDAADKIWDIDDFHRDYNINLKNLKMIIDTMKETTPNYILNNYYLLKDKNGVMNEANKECLQILNDGILWANSYCSKVEKFKEAKDKDGNFNIDFCKKFNETVKKHNTSDAKPYVSPLLTCLEYMKNKDETINWEATDIAFPLLLNFFSTHGLVSASSSHEMTNKFLTQLTLTMRDDNGDFYEAGMNKIKKAAEKYKDVEIFDEDEMFAYMEMNDAMEKAKEMNLSSADEMYGFIKDLKSKGNLSAEHFSTPIDKNGNTLLMYIADIPQEAENEYEYEQILKILKSIPDIDYTQQDKFGITFLEKVINSENTELLNLMKNKEIKYYPMLDYAYKGVQSQEFENKLKKLKLIFPELEEAIRINSTEAFEKVKQQLDSPFCSKEIKEKLFDIAQESKNFTMMAYIKKSMMN